MRVGEKIGSDLISITSIADHAGFVPLLAEAFAREWPDWCARVGRPAVEALFDAGPAGSLPVVLVAHAGGELLGTVALRPWFAEEPMPETPWVRQLYVFPRHRGRGVDRILCAEVERQAAVLGFATLHAATNRIERLLIRRGWEVFGSRDGLTWLRKIGTTGAR